MHESDITEDEWWRILESNWFFILDAICSSIDTFSYTNYNGKKSNVDIYHQLIHAKKWFKPIPLVHYMSEASFGFPEVPPIHLENGIFIIGLLLQYKDVVLPDAKFIPEEGEEWKYL